MALRRARARCRLRRVPASLPAARRAITFLSPTRHDRQSSTCGRIVQQLLHLATRQRPALARLQLAIQPQRAQADAHQPPDLQLLGHGHAPDLPLAPFVHGDVQPDALFSGWIVRRRHHGRMLQHPPMGGSGHSIVQLDAAPEMGQRVGAGHAIDQHQIALGMLKARVAQLQGQVAVVGQQQQALAVQVQPADGIETQRAFEQRFQARPAARVVEDRQHAHGLVEHQIAAPLLGARLE